MQGGRFQGLQLQRIVFTGAAFGPHPPPQGRKGLLQCCEVVGLLHIGVGPFRHEPFSVALHGVCGHGHDRNGGGQSRDLSRTDGLQGCHAIEDGHLDVEEHGIEVLFRECLQRLTAVFQAWAR